MSSTLQKSGATLWLRSNIFPKVSSNGCRSNHLGSLHVPGNRHRGSGHPLSPALGLISGSCPSARVFAPRFLQTPPRDGSPCASLSLLLHQDVKRTSTSKLSFMRGVPIKGGRALARPPRFADLLTRRLAQLKMSFIFSNSPRLVGVFSITMVSPNCRSNSFCCLFSFDGVATRIST